MAKRIMERSANSPVRASGGDEPIHEAAPVAVLEQPAIELPHDGVRVGMLAYWWMPMGDRLEPRSAEVIGRAPMPGTWYVVVQVPPGFPQRQVARFAKEPTARAFTNRKAFDGYSDTGDPF